MSANKTERFTSEERGALYWVAWWMGQQEDQRQLGGTLKLALKVVRKMVGKVPDGYKPLDIIQSDSDIYLNDDVKQLVALAEAVKAQTWDGGNREATEAMDAALAEIDEALLERVRR